MDLTVYTSIIGNYDTLNKPNFKGKYVVYSDLISQSKGWEVKRALTPFKDPTRNARMYKILPHQFIKTEWSLWIDGSIDLLVSPDKILKKYGWSDIVMFNAVEYNCIYIEGEKVIELNKDNAETVNLQLDKYRKEGFPKNYQLTATGCILRHHTKKVEQFNNAWWSELCRHSRRDQLSVDYTAWKLGINFGYFDGNIYDSPEFILRPHRKD